MMEVRTLESQVVKENTRQDDPNYILLEKLLDSVCGQSLWFVARGGSLLFCS